MSKKIFCSVVNQKICQSKTLTAFQAGVSDFSGFMLQCFSNDGAG